MKTEKELDAIRSILAEATGTESYHRLFKGSDSFLFTDGIKALAEACECWWLVTDIALFVSHVPALREEPFLVWKLELGEDGFAWLNADDGNGKVCYKGDIPYTDFPLPEGVKLYYDNGVLMLPSEY